MLYRLISSLLCAIIFSSSILAETPPTIPDIFDEIISPHIDNSFVHYHRIDKAKLTSLVEKIGSYNINREVLDDTLAFYLNAYNTLTIKGVIDGYGPHSFFSRYTFFKGNKYLVAGEEITLDTLEHKIIRPLNEPRIHFALVCAAASCPPLRPEAYRGHILDKQLDDQAILFINNTEKNNFNLSKKQSNLSSIFKWFEKDFLLEAKSLNQYIAVFVRDQKVKAVLEKDELKVKFNQYDWSLNGKR